MKKFILPVLLISGLTLFSFTNPTEGGVRKIGKQLYEVEANTKFSESHKRTLNEIIVREYKLTDAQLRQAQTEEGIELSFLAKGWIFKKKFSFMSMFDEQLIVWQEPSEPSKQIEEIERILEAYVIK